MSTQLSHLHRSAVLLAIALAAASLVIGLLVAPRTAGQASVDRPFVHCRAIAATNPPQYTIAAMSCTTEDGMVFDDGGITVPAGYRFYVTDIILTYAAATYMTQYSGNTAVAHAAVPRRRSALPGPDPLQLALLRVAPWRAAVHRGLLGLRHRLPADKPVVSAWCGAQLGGADQRSGERKDAMPSVKDPRHTAGATAKRHALALIVAVALLAACSRENPTPAATSEPIQTTAPVAARRPGDRNARAHGDAHRHSDANATGQRRRPGAGRGQRPAGGRRERLGRRVCRRRPTTTASS